MYEIEFYDTEEGKRPVHEFIDSLEPKLKAKTLRTKHSSNITRIIYFFYIGKKAILTNGFIKKTMKTPKSELYLAKKYKEDYERRYRT